MEWKFYFGACFLTAAMLVPRAGLRPVAAGMVLAGAIFACVSLLSGPRL
jgi:hypothetical protein